MPGSVPPTAANLKLLHAAQVERIPYEVVDIQLGRVTSIDPGDSMKRVLTGRGGYCYHLNGAFSALLRVLGYQVAWHRAGVQNHPADIPGPAAATHLALTVHGLPSADCPDGDWLVDAGLGDGLYQPLPLREGGFTQGPFTYRLRRSPYCDGWRFDHDPAGSFAGMDFESRTAVIEDFTARHVYLSTAPDSGFVRICTVQRRDAAGFDALTGCVLRRAGDKPAELTVDRRADWFAALADVFGLPLTDLGPADRDRLWGRVASAHESWLAAKG